LLRPEALEALRGCERIVHGGDIGAPEVLEALRVIAPVTAVRGNNDRAPWARQIPEVAVLEAAGVRVLVIHDLAELAIDPGEAGYAAVISGHSHKPLVREDRGVLYVNPGSAGPRRFKLPISVGFLSVARGGVTARLLEL
jgi:putative phosphoesterase